MGAWLGRRTEPRVDYRESVRVIWPGEVSGVVARAVNLSSTGILIDAPTPTPCAVGSDVLCDVSLPRGPRLLRGRVAHRRVLPSAKVGMGIEFVDLSPREVAELRDVVDESDQRQGAPQRVKVRFAGTNQVVRARAFPTEDGFRLATSLPFLKPDTEVDISLAPDESVSARGWVSAVALERGIDDGIPRLFIDVDVRVDDPDPWRDRSSALTPVVEPLAEALRGEPLAAALREAVPEHVWQPDELGAAAASLDGPVELAGPTASSLPTLAASSPALPTIFEASGALPPTIFEASGAQPTVEDAELTEIVMLDPRPSRWRAIGSGMLVGALALAGVVVGIVLVKAPGLTPAPAVKAPLSPRTIVAEPLAPAPVAVALAAAAPAEPVAAGPAEPVAAPVAVAPASVVAAPVAAAPVVAAPAGFTVGLTGSLSGSRRYPLSNPDGVAFNLPHARATMALGTYRPDVPGLRSVWVRALPGGGAHLRFFFKPALEPGAEPLVELARDAVRVTAR